MKAMTSKEIGHHCQVFRKGHGIRQSKIADELGYTISNISAFECGHNDNSVILSWYLLHGMSVDELRGVTNGKSI